MKLLFRNDFNVKCKWLRYGHLTTIGFTEDELYEIKNNKSIFKMRLFFTDTILKEQDIKERFLNDNFSEEKANELTSLILLQEKEAFLLFINEFNFIKRFKNYDISYWSNRGYSLIESKEKLKNFFTLGMKSINKKRLKSFIYNYEFIQSRKQGGKSSHVSNFNIKINGSKIENEIKKVLKEKYNLRENNYFSPCNNIELNQLYNKRNFIHDFLINDKFIIEYNGGYWHKDYFNFKQFSKEDYMFEIKKAHNCIFEVERKNKLNYIIIWENDFDNDVDKIIHYIDYIIGLNESLTFYSSREIDYDYFNDYRKQFIKKEKEKEKFTKIVSELSKESHCEKIKVSAIAVKNGRIVSTGINGTPSTWLNCDDYFKYVHKFDNIKIKYNEWIKTEDWMKLHHDWADCNEIHAEISLISNAAKNGIELNECDIYLTHSPCIHCAKAIIPSGIKNIYYINEYDKFNINSKNLLNECGITISQIERIKNV